MRRRTLILLLVVAAVAGSGAAGVYWWRSEAKPPPYRTAPAERGELLSTISATGTLNAVTTVQVGTQVSGTIAQLFADFNSPVKKGMVIARIDPAAFEAKVNQATADVESAKASVLNQKAARARAEADLANARANVVRQEVAVRDAEIKLDSRIRLFKEGGISQEERDSARAAHDSALAQLDANMAGVRAAQASLEVARAQVASAEAQVRQKQAFLVQTQVDLNNTFIRAPVDGVVVSRNVDVGQTVAASLQAPTLFLIAQDLTKMQVDTNVDEADIGRVALDQEATFSVDSYPGRVFHGRVVQIRQAPQVVQNVVTYNTVVAVSNPDLRLKPGMTANVKLLVARRDNALLVPNAAFRVRIEGVAAGVTGGARQGNGAGQGGAERMRQGGGPGGSSGSGRPGMGDGSRQRIFLLKDGAAAERLVKTGLSDGQKTEILEGLTDGETVIVGQGTAARGSTASSAPRLRL